MHIMCVCVCVCVCVTGEAHHIPPAVLAPCRCVILIKQRHISEGRISILYILLSGTRGVGLITSRQSVEPQQAMHTKQISAAVVFRQYINS